MMREDGIGAAVAPSSGEAIRESASADVTAPTEPYHCPAPEDDGIIDLSPFFHGCEGVQAVRLHPVPSDTTVRVIL